MGQGEGDQQAGIVMMMEWMRHRQCLTPQMLEIESLLLQPEKYLSLCIYHLKQSTEAASRPLSKF